MISLLALSLQLPCTFVVRHSNKDYAFCARHMQAYSQVNGEISFETSGDRSSLAQFSGVLQNNTINITVPGKVQQFALLSVGTSLNVVGCQVQVESQAQTAFAGLTWFSKDTVLLDSFLNFSQLTANGQAAGIATETQQQVQITATYISVDFSKSTPAALIALKKSADLSVSLVGSKLFGKVSASGSPLIVGVINTFTLTNSQYCVTGTPKDEQGVNCKPLCHAGFVLNLAKTACVASGECGPNTVEIQPPQCSCVVKFPYDSDYDLCMPPPKTISTASFPAVVIVNVQKTAFLRLESIQADDGDDQVSLCANGDDWGELLFLKTVLSISSVQKVGGVLWGVVRHFKYIGCVKMSDVWNGQYSSLRMLKYNAKTYANSSAPQYSDRKKTTIVRTIPANKRIQIDDVYFDPATGYLYGSTTYAGKSGFVNMSLTNTSTLVPTAMSIPFVELANSRINSLDLSSTLAYQAPNDIMVASSVSCSGQNCEEHWALVNFQKLSSSSPTTVNSISGKAYITFYEWNGNYFAPDNLSWVTFKVVVVPLAPKTATTLRASPSNTGTVKGAAVQWSTFTVRGIYRCVDDITDGSLWGFVSNTQGYINMADVQRFP